jgi:acetyl esterase/lipase
MSLAMFRKQSQFIVALLLAATSARAAAESIVPRPAQDFEAAKYVPGVPSPDFRPHDYVERGGVPLKLFVFAAGKQAAASERPAAAVLLFHSGGWTRGRPEWLFGLAKRFAERSLVAIPVEYRLSKAPPAQGTGVTPIDALADACAAFRWVRTHARELSIDPARIAGWGASAGGQLVAATATAGCPPAAAPAPSGAANALVLVSAGVDTANSEQFKKLTGLDATGAEVYSPLAHVRKGVPSTLVIAGKEDAVTRVESHRLFCQKAKQVGGDCAVEEYAGLGHLLTRKLDDQRTTLDPDPRAEEDAIQKQERFLERIGFLPRRTKPGSAR